MRLSTTVLLACVSFLGESSSLGKRPREIFDMEDGEDDEMEEQETEVMTVIESSTELTPRDAMVFILSFHPTLSASELMNALDNQFGVSLNFLETWRLRDQLLSDARMPNWLHDILFILVPGQRLNISQLGHLAPVGSRLYFDQVDLDRKIDMWLRLCIDPLRLYRRTPLLERQRPPPCVPSMSTAEWSLTETPMKLYFSSLLHS